MLCPGVVSEYKMNLKMCVCSYFVLFGFGIFALLVFHLFRFFVGLVVLRDRETEIQTEIETIKCYMGKKVKRNLGELREQKDLKV